MIIAIGLDINLKISLSSEYYDGLHIGAASKLLLSEPQFSDWSACVEGAEFIKKCADLFLPNTSPEMYHTPAAKEMYRLIALKINTYRAILADTGCTDSVRGFIAGQYFGDPLFDDQFLNNTFMAKAEARWRADTDNTVEHYQEICRQILRTGMPDLTYFGCFDIGEATVDFIEL